MVICQRGAFALLYPCIPTDWWLSPYGYGERYVTGSCVVTRSPRRKVSFKRERAHVVALEQKLGRPLRPGMQANHHCDDRACIQREHLYEGTQQQNVQDMWDRKRGWSPFAHGLIGNPRGHGFIGKPKVLTPEKEAEVQQRYAAGGISQAALAAEYGVSQPTISRVVLARR